MTKIILFLALAAILVTGTLSVDQFAFADKDDKKDYKKYKDKKDDKKYKDKKDDKTLRDICKKQAGKDNFKGLICEVLYNAKKILNTLQDKVDANMMSITTLDTRVTDLEENGVGEPGPPGPPGQDGEPGADGDTTELTRKVDCNLIKVSMNLPLQFNVDNGGCDFSGEDLRGIQLSGADLSGANFFDVEIRGVNLSGVNLSGANFFGVNLSGVNLDGANLDGANLNGAFADPSCSNHPVCSTLPKSPP